jgi:type 2 lantibiotic biosynthesis protein LanM
MESGAYAIIEWLNQRGLEPSLAAARVLDRNQYGWVSNLDPAPCADQAAIHRFYRRQGANLALAYMLGATDLHFENVLAVGEHPIIVDWETLFQAPPESGAKGATGAASAIIRDSAVRTLLLPTRIHGEGDRHADIGAFGYLEAQEAPFSALSWLGSGTDEMRAHRSYGVLPPGDCLPVLDGRRVPARAYVGDIEAGFNEAYGFFQRRKRSLLDDRGPLAVFRRGVARHVFRPTAHYARLLTESWDVRFAQDSRILSAYLHAHISPGVAAKGHDALAAAEVEAIIAGDIPFFLKRVSGRTALAPGRRPRRVRLSGNGWLMTRRRIAALSERDRERQNWIARAAFAESSDELPRNRARPRRLDYGEMINLAEDLGDRLCDTAIIRGKGASWLFPSIGADRRLTPAVCDYDLYNGLSGIALFLGRLGRVSGRLRYFEAARAALHEALALYRTTPDSASVGCGGDAGLAYALALLARWLECDNWAAQARSIIGAAVERDPTALDLMEGRAGLLLGATTVAAILGDHGLIAKTRPLAHALRDLTASELPASKDCGLAHGRAGLGYALARWAQAAADRECLARAKWLLRTDFNTGANARARGNALGDGPTMLAWCRGGLGAAWALLSLRLSPSAVTRVIANVSSDARPRGQGALCPCHGLLGVTDFLVDARNAGTPGADKALRPLQTEVLGRLLSGETCADHTHRLENPGLFLGVAGAGYLVLRLADPRATPSALMLHTL